MNEKDEELLANLLGDLSQKLIKESAKFIKEKVVPHKNLVDRFTHILPLMYFHSMNVTIAEWLDDKDQLETYKNRMEEDLKRYLTEFREKF